MATIIYHGMQTMDAEDFSHVTADGDNVSFHFKSGAAPMRFRRDEEHALAFLNYFQADGRGTKVEPPPKPTPPPKPK